MRAIIEMNQEAKYRKCVANDGLETVYREYLTQSGLEDTESTLESFLRGHRTVSLCRGFSFSTVAITSGIGIGILIGIFYGIYGIYWVIKYVFF